MHPTPRNFKWQNIECNTTFARNHSRATYTDALEDDLQILTRWRLVKIHFRETLHFECLMSNVMSYVECHVCRISYVECWEVMKIHSNVVWNKWYLQSEGDLHIFTRVWIVKFTRRLFRMLYVEYSGRHGSVKALDSWSQVNGFDPRTRPCVCPWARHLIPHCFSWKWVPAIFSWGLTLR